MTSPGQEEYSGVCPYLGLGDDADSHATYPTDAHRCYRLENPTRIAPGHQQTYCLEANHVTCPVFRGEGVAAAAPAATAAAGGGTRTRPTQPPRAAEEGGAKRPPRAGSTTAFGGRRSAAGGTAGSVGPRPREGGISMRAATFFLLAAAVVIVVLALFIQNRTGGSSKGGNPLVPAALQTNQALTPSRTPQPGGATTPVTGTPRTGTPGATTPPAGTPGTGTPGAGTPAGTPGAGAKTYTVKSGDTCGAIASANGVTLDQLLTANQLTEDACTRLQVGQVLKLP